MPQGRSPHDPIESAALPPRTESGNPAPPPDFIAFMALVRPKICGFLARRRVPLEDAQDLVQDALVAVLTRWEEMRDIESREAWLLAILRNKLSRHWRQRESEERLRAAVLTQNPSSTEPPPQTRQDSHFDVATLAAKLNDRDLQILWLRYGLELSNAEAALELGCQANSVRKLSLRALKRAQRLIA